MGLDACFRRFSDEDFFDMRNHWEFNDLLLRVHDGSDMRVPVGVPIPITNALLDALEEMIGEEDDAPAAEISEDFLWGEPEDWEAAQPTYLAMIAALRDRLAAGDSFFYCYSC